MTTKVLVVGADPAPAELLEEWLTLESFRAVAERPGPLTHHALRR